MTTNTKTTTLNADAIKAVDVNAQIRAARHATASSFRWARYWLGAVVEDPTNLFRAGKSVGDALSFAHQSGDPRTIEQAERIKGCFYHRTDQEARNDD
jgi:hypothetical protein